MSQRGPSSQLTLSLEAGLVLPPVNLYCLPQVGQHVLQLSMLSQGGASSQLPLSLESGLVLPPVNLYCLPQVGQHVL